MNGELGRYEKSFGVGKGDFQVAVITVALAEETARLLSKTIEQRAWLPVEANFDGYVSSTRRPSIGNAMLKASACFAFIDFDDDLGEAVLSTEYLRQQFGDKIFVIAISKQNDSNSILAAMRAGCSEYLIKPLSQNDLDKVLNRLEEQIKPQPAHVSTPNSLLTLVGAKGGAGSTTLAVYLALYLAQGFGKKTLLVDQKSQLGHACVYLGIDGSNYTFQELVRNVARLDSELLHGFVAKHKSGLDVISSPDAIGNVKDLDPDSIRRAIDFLRTEYDYIVVDGDTNSWETLQPFLEVSSSIYLVGTPEMGSIRDLSRYADKFILNDAIGDKLQVAINRINLPSAITAEQIEKAMKLPVAIKIPNCSDLLRAENLGEPLSIDRDIAFTEAVLRWIEKLTGQARKNTATKKEKKLFLWRERAPVH